MQVKAFFGLIPLVVTMACNGCNYDQSKPSEAATPLASVASPSPTPCTFFADMYPVSEESFVAHHASAKERKMILHWSATVSAKDRPYLRWMHIDGGIVFVADPNYFAPYSQWYKAWSALNTSIVVNPVQCDIYPVPRA